jgi:hypothetical protein
MMWTAPWRNYAPKVPRSPLVPLTRNPGLRLAFIRGPEGIMIELVQR